MILTEKDIEKYKSASEIFEEAKGKIETRVDEVIKIICKIFGRKLDTWYWLDAPEGGMGSFPHDLPNPDKNGFGEVDFNLVTHGGRSADTDEWDYSYSFPRKFLFMSDDDIRAEIKKQIQDTEDNAKKKKAKRLANAEAKKKLKVVAKKKLTREERKALGIK